MAIGSDASYSDHTPQASEDQLQSLLQAERQIARLRTLQEVSSKLNSKLDLEEALATILDEAIRTFGAERGCLLLVDAATGELEVRLSRRLRPSDLNGKAFRLSRTVIERVWHDGKPVLTDNASEDPELTKADSVIRYRLRSILCVPLHVQGQPAGVLYLDNRLKTGQFQEDDLALVVAIADQAAIALHNAQLYQSAQQELAKRARAEEETRRRSHELVLLNQAGLAFSSTLDLNVVLTTVLEGVRYLLDVTGASIWLVDLETGQLVCRQATSPGGETVRGWRLALDQGLAGWVASSGEGLIVPDVEADERFFEGIPQKMGLTIRSVLCAPLRTKRGVIGVIHLVDEEIEHFDSTDLTWLEALASSAAIAIENAQLYAQIRQVTIEQERHRLARELHDTVTQSLYSIGMAAQTSLKLLDRAEVDGKFRDPIEYILQLSRAALAQMGEQLYGLHPTDLADKGLVETLAQHCQLLKTRYLLSIAFKAEPELPLLMFQQEALYYVAREALWNVVRHAGATRVDISLALENDQLTLSVADDGAGFDPSVLALDESIGLRSMKERTELLGGIFELESGPGQGTQIAVRIPIRPSEYD